MGKFESNTTQKAFWIKKQKWIQEYKSEKDNKSSLKGYLEKIRPHLCDMIDNLKKSGECRMYLTIKPKFMSSTHSNEKHTMYPKSDSGIVMISNDRVEIIQKLFDSHLHKYQIWNNLWGVAIFLIMFQECDMRYLCDMITINRGWSHIDSSKRFENKKSTINPKNDDKNCFRYAMTIALNHEQVGKDPQRITQFYHFINEYDRKDIDFSRNAKDWKKFETNSKSIALNVLQKFQNII